MIHVNTLITGVETINMADEGYARLCDYLYLFNATIFLANQRSLNLTCMYIMFIISG